MMNLICPGIIRQINAPFHSVSGQAASQIGSASVEIFFPVHLEDELHLLLWIVGLNRHPDTVYKLAESLHRLQ